VQRRVLAYSKTGHRRHAINLPGSVSGIGDLAVRGAQLAVLDISRSVVLLLDPESGSVQQMVELPPAFGLTTGLPGISHGPDGELLLEFECGWRTARLVDAALGSAAIQVGRPLVDGWLTASYDGLPVGLGHRADVRYRSVTVEIVTKDYLGGVSLVGEWQGGIDLLVEEMSQGVGGRVTVVQTVRRFDREGRPTAIWTAVHPTARAGLQPC